MKTKSQIGMCVGLVLVLGAPIAYSQGVRYEAVTVGATAVGLSSATIDPADTDQNTRCQARLETAQIRQRWDGTDPTATEGELVEVGDVVEISGYATMARIRWIRTGGTSGTLRVHCWRHVPDR